MLSIPIYIVLHSHGINIIIIPTYWNLYIQREFCDSKSILVEISFITTTPIQNSRQISFLHDNFSSFVGNIASSLSHQLISSVCWHSVSLSADRYCLLPLYKQVICFIDDSFNSSFRFLFQTFSYVLPFKNIYFVEGIGFLFLIRQNFNW